MTSAIRYVFLDALQGTIIEEISLQSVRFSNTLSGGEFSATFALDQTGMTNDQLVAATIPGRCLLVAETDANVLWGGLVWSRTYQSQAKSVQLYAKTLDQYPSKRIVNYSRDLSGWDPRNLMIQMYFDMQFDPHSITVTLPSPFPTDNPVDFSVDTTENKTYKSVMDQLATSIDGFEWTIDWARTGNSYSKTLRIAQPLGAAPGDTNPVFEYPGNILNYWRNDTIGSGGTNIFGIGAGEGDNMGIVEVVHNDLLDNGFPRLDTTVSFKDIEDIDALQQLTLTQANIAKVPQPFYTVQMKADREPAFGDYGLGDWCKLVFNDPLHPSPGLTVPTRILGWDYTPQQSDAASEVQLMFQGDEDSDG